MIESPPPVTEPIRITRHDGSILIATPTDEPYKFSIEIEGRPGVNWLNEIEMKNEA